MRKTDKVTREVTQEILQATVCDKCGLEENFDRTVPSTKDKIVTVGYVQADNSLRATDLCRTCLEELLGEYMRDVTVPEAPTYG